MRLDFNGIQGEILFDALDQLARNRRDEAECWNDGTSKKKGCLSEAEAIERLRDAVRSVLDD